MMGMFDIRKVTLALVVAGGIGFFAGTAFTDDPTDPGQAAQDAMMEMMKRLATPNVSHERLARMEGDWDVAVRAWPGGKLEESSGRCTARMVLGGRYLQSTWDGEVMGETHSGISMLGYDNGKQQYHSQWYDTMGTGVYTMTGNASADGDSITMHGTWTSPDESMSMKTKMVFTFKDADTYVMEHYAVVGDQEKREMELTYTRRKSEAPARRVGPGCCPPRGKGPGY